MMVRSGVIAGLGATLRGLSRRSTTFNRKKSARLQPAIEAFEERLLLAMNGVDVINSTFAPNPVTIHVGDMVEWVWDTDNRSVTSVAGSVEQFNSGVQNTGFMFDHVFTNADTFTYYSTVEGHDNGDGTASGMSGEIIVLPPSPLAMVMVTPANFNLAPGNTFPYMAMGMYADSVVEDISADVTWSSSNPDVATVVNGTASPGVVAAMSPGTTTIMATLGGMSASTALTVTGPPPAVWVTGITDTVKKGLVTAITVQFSGPVNAAEVADMVNYQVVMPGKKNSFNAANARALKLRIARYDPAQNEVVLKPRKAFALSKAVELKVNGSLTTGLRDTTGQVIDGDHNGQPGGDAVAVLARKKITLNGVVIATMAPKPALGNGLMGSMGAGSSGMMPMGDMMNGGMVPGPKKS